MFISNYDFFVYIFLNEELHLQCFLGICTDARVSRRLRQVHRRRVDRGRHHDHPRSPLSRPIRCQFNQCYIYEQLL
jgi:hypothetical protein